MIKTIEKAEKMCIRDRYCMLYDNDAGNFERYEAIGEAGQRTINALKQIVTVARNSTQVKPTANVTITAQDNQEIRKQYRICL